MACIRTNPINESKSVLFDELVKVLGTEELADDAYSRTTGPTFISEFGDWITDGKESYENNQYPNDRLYDNGEPKLKSQTFTYGDITTTQYYFEYASGEPIFINQIRFPKMEPNEINEVTNQLMYEFINKDKNFDYNDTESLDWSKLDSVIEESMKEYLSEFPEHADRVANVLEYKKEFAQEVKEKVEATGFKYLERGLTETGEDSEDIAEEDKITAVNIKDNFETSSKASSKNNVKLILSQIPEINWVRNEDGEVEGEIKLGEYLNRPAFVELDEIWSTLEPILADTVGHGDETDAVTDVFGKMITKIQSLSEAKPWAAAVVEVIDGLSPNKKLEFVQAFSLVRLNFNVTEFNPGNNSYVVINATATNSKASQVKDKWTQAFKDDYVTGKTITPDASEVLLYGIQELNETFFQFRDDASQFGVVEAISMNLERIKQDFKTFSIDINGNDLNAFLVIHGEKDAYNNFAELFTRTGQAFADALQKKTLFENGVFMSPIAQEKSIHMLAQAVGFSSPDMSDNTILMNKGKMAWTYSTPSHLHNSINRWKADPKEGEKLNAIEYNRNSRWSKFITAKEMVDGEFRFDIQNDRDIKAAERTDGITLALASSFKSKGKNDGTDAKSIKPSDAINDSLVKILGSKIGQATIFPTVIAADKSKKFEIKGFDFFDAKSDYTVKDGYNITDETVDVFIGYFEDEYNRMRRVWREIDTLPESELVEFYHKSPGKDDNKKPLPPNGTISQLFPGLSPHFVPPKLKQVLYKDGKPLDMASMSFTDEQLALLKPAMRSLLVKNFKITEQMFIDNNMLRKDKDDVTIQSAIPGNLIQAYKNEKKNNPIQAIIGDYTINGLIANIEYSKIFSGDPAFYKNPMDMLKRIPGTYTDGLQLSLETREELVLNVAYIEDIVVDSKYHQAIKDSLPHGSKGLAEAYLGVDTTDAQAWITPNRWKFIKQKLGQWDNVQEKAYKKMLAGKKLTKKELKLSMQPLKGVYFGMDKTGKPTYLKYSQSVLLPDLIKGTPMQGLYNKMVNDPDTNKPWDNASKEIHEIITSAGVKVGNTGVKKIHDKNGLLAEKDIELNKIELSNRHWKLQQDLPTKGAKETAVGSQIQKNILDELIINENEAYLFEGKMRTGQFILDEINRTVSDLSNMGVEEIKKKFGIINDKITDKNALYAALIKDFKGKNADENVIAALEKRLPFDAIPQLGAKLESAFLSMTNKDITKIQTNGGAYIQVTPFGIETIPKGTESGIKIVSDNYNRKGLQPPRVINGKVLPGQAFLPHNAIAPLIGKAVQAGALKHGTNLANISESDLKDILDSSALEMVTYRIPNQGMSSNDALEIVGILPEGLGDTIIAYDGIPAKTGSDFDIDKMFAMFPNMEFNAASGKIQKTTSKGNSKKATQNRLFDLYKSVLTSTNTYDNLVKSIDSKGLRDDINSIVPEPSMGSLQLFNPAQQIKTKFEYMSGKLGVAQTANHLVDHISSQSLDLRLDLDLGIGNSFNGLTQLDQVNDTDGNKIADTLSQFLNAYVDIAKDPYISRGNHNTFTADTTFMLIRSGVPLEWVNRFMAQPAIKKYIETKFQLEGITRGIVRDPATSKGYVNAKEYMTAVHGIEGSPITTLQTANITIKKLEQGLKQDLSNPNSNPNDRKWDNQILSTFIHFEKKGMALGKAVRASKADTKGSTGSFVGRLVAENTIKEVLREQEIFGFFDKIKGSTMIATYTYNAIDWIGTVAHNSDIFLSAKNGSSNSFNVISDLMGKGLLKNAELGKKIETGMTSYNMSKLDIFQDLNYDELYIELPKRLKEYQNSNPDNFFTNHLQIKFANNKDYIKVDNKNKPATYKNFMYRSWAAMLRSPDLKERSLAEDLVKYSFAQSGFRFNINEFFSYIPHSYLTDHNIVETINASMRNSNEFDVDDFFIDQFFRHNWPDDKVVPVIRTGDIVPGHNLMGGFILDPEKSERLATNVEYEEGDKKFLYPNFLRYDFDNDRGQVVSQALYELVGGTEVNGNIAPVYKRTHKLGVRETQGGVVEYAYAKSKKSIIKTNNVNKTEKNIADKVINSIDIVVSPEDMTNYVDPGFVQGDRFDDKLMTALLKESKEDPDQEQRNTDGQVENMSDFAQKVEDFKSKINAEVIIDPDTKTSRVLSSSDPRTIAAGKPVILINPNKVFNDTIPHEFAHIFIDSVPGGLSNPRVKKALEQLKGTPLYAETKELYPELTEDLFAKELLAQAMGREGAVQWQNAKDQSSFQAFLNWMFDYLKRTFGLDRNAVKELVQEMMYTTTDVGNFQASTDMEYRTSKEQEELSQLDRNYWNIMTKITNLKEAYTPKTRKQITANKRLKERSHYAKITKLEKEVKALEGVDHRRAILKYVMWANGVVSNQAFNLEVRKTELAKKGLELDAKQIMHYKKNLDALSGIDSIIDLILSEGPIGRGTLDAKEVEIMTRRAKAVQSKVELQLQGLLAASKENFAKVMSQNSTEHLQEWEKKYAEEFETLSPKGYTEIEYIIEKMGENKAQIDAEAYNKFLTRASESTADVNVLAGMFVSEKNLSSKEIQIVSQLIDKVDQEVDIFSNEAASETDAQFKEFDKVHGAVTAKQRYQKFIDETDGQGTYLIGEYTADYLVKYREAYSWNNSKVAEEKYADVETSGEQHYIIDGKKIKFDLKRYPGKVVGEFWVPKVGTQIPIKKAIGKSEYNIWMSKNTKTVGKKTFPADKYINKAYNKLSDQDIVFLNQFKESARRADELYDRKNSLISRKASQEFVRLPGILKSDIERVLEGQGKDFVQDKYKDLTQVRQDEFHYGPQAAQDAKDEKDPNNRRVKADVNNREVFDVPVPFRAVLSSKDQSFDLHSIFLLNLVHSKNNQLKTDLDDTIGVFLNVMMKRDDPKMSGLDNKQHVHGWSIDRVAKVFKDKDALSNSVKTLISMREQRMYGIRNTGSTKAHKVVGAGLKVSGTVSLLLNTAAEMVNVATGTVSNLIESIGGETYTFKDHMAASRKYWKDLKNIMDDMGSHVQTSRTNMFMNVFNTMGDRNFLNNKFEESNRVRTLSKTNNLRFMAQAGEHMMQSKVMYSVMNSIKVLNAKGQFLNNKGQVVKSKKEAASLDEVMVFNQTPTGTAMSLPSWVEATTHTLTGGHDRILLETRSVIKKKVIDLHGLYDTDIQSAAQREWWGKAMFFLRKWMLPTVQRRWRGASKMLVSSEELRDVDKFYSEDMKAFQEGYYTTAVRFVRVTVPDMVRSGPLEALNTGYENLSKMEKANLKKAIVEIGAIVLTALLYNAVGEEGEDDWLGLRARYLLRREMSELMFYWNPMESYKIAATPTAGMSFIEKSLRAFNQSFSPSETYTQGYNKGRNKLSKKVGDLIPVWAQAQRDIDASLKFLQW